MCLCCCINSVAKKYNRGWYSGWLSFHSRNQLCFGDGFPAAGRFYMHPPNKPSLSSLHKERAPLFAKPFVEAWAGMALLSSAQIKQAEGESISDSYKRAWCECGGFITWIESLWAWGFCSGDRTDKKSGQAEHLTSSVVVSGQMRLLPLEMPSSSIAPSHCDVTFLQNALFMVSQMQLDVAGEDERESLHFKKKLITVSNQVKARN